MCFRENFHDKVAVIVDWFEPEAQKPYVQVHSKSKFAFGGRVSDKQIKNTFFVLQLVTGWHNYCWRKFLKLIFYQI